MPWPHQAVLTPEMMETPWSIEVFVIQGPTLLDIHKRDTGAVASRYGPGVLRIDAIRRGIQVALPRPLGIISRGDDGRRCRRRF